MFFNTNSFNTSGTTEAFLHAVASKDQLSRSNKFMFVCSGVYIVLNLLLLPTAGTIGLIAANSISILSGFISILGCQSQMSKN